MKTIKSQILNVLQNLKGSGKFASVGNIPFVLPGLSIDKNEELSFPLSENEVRKLINFSEQAPFGKGSETIVDTSVRNTWEIDAERIQFYNPQWAKSLDLILNKIKKDLGLKNYTIKANLYKLLVYEKGGFFLPHKDSEKEKGMFGTLVVDLPSKFTGGKLHISFDREVVTADFSNGSPYEIDFAGFYADCNHEVKEVTSGYRVCLVYNLVQEENQSKIEWSSIRKHTYRLAQVFQNYKSDKPYVILLGHQYTPKNFSYKNLKLNDRLKAEVLLETARKLGFYSNLCLVTSYKAGTPKYTDYYNEPDDEVMDEVYDESLEIEYWQEKNNPILSQFSFEEEDLITSFELDEDEPIVKENSGYMGNYGPEIYYWYHYGAVVLWSPEVNAAFFPHQSTQTKLDWINYFISGNKYTLAEKKSVNQFVKNGLSFLRDGENINYNALIDWFIFQKNEKLFLDLDNPTIQYCLERIDTDKLIVFLGYLSENERNKFFDKMTDDTHIVVIEKLIEVLKILTSDKKWHSFTLKWVEKLPVFIEECYQKDNKVIVRETFTNLFIVEKNLGLAKDWAIKMANALVVKTNRDKIHLIVKQQLLGKEDNSSLWVELKRLCISFLQDLVNNKPSPPKDWKREMPQVKTQWHQKQWAILRPFLESPTGQVFDYKKVQADRTKMEQAISSVTVDLKMETIRKGSPHTLRITKTQASYERAYERWRQDCILLDKII